MCVPVYFYKSPVNLFDLINLLTNLLMPILFLPQSFVGFWWIFRFRFRFLKISKKFLARINLEFQRPNSEPIVLFKFYLSTNSEF